MLYMWYTQDFQLRQSVEDIVRKIPDSVDEQPSGKEERNAWLQTLGICHICCHTVTSL